MQANRAPCGLFIWVRLPDGTDCARLEALAAERGVSFSQGSEFHVEGRRSVPRARCDHPVDEHISVGKRIGVKATPTFVTDDGRLIRGYGTPERLERKIRGG